jgi:uncharacterized protein
MKASNYNIWVERGESAYVFNGVTGSLLQMSKQDRDSLQAFLAGVKGATCSPKLLAHLANGLMVIPDDTDELDLLARRYQFSRYDTSRFALTIVTSLGCNFDCPYCFEAKHPSIMDQRCAADDHQGARR